MRLTPPVRTGGEKPSTVFRRMIKEATKPIIGVGGGTAHHAQLAERAGFPYFGVSGAYTAAQLFGLPDAGFLTLPEIAENTRRICNAVSIPVMVDCDTGFGNALNVVRTVSEIISAGAASLFIEDQVAPKRCGFVKGKQLVPVDEALSKYRAALDTRDSLDPDFIIIARTDARGAVGGGLDEALRRGEAYLRAGVDVLYVEALQSREEMRIVREAFPDAVLKLSTQAINPPLTTEEFAAFGPVLNKFFIGEMGAVAMSNFLADFATRGSDALNDFSRQYKDHPLVGFGFFDLTGFPQVVEMEKKYMSQEALERYEQSIGVYDPTSRAALSLSNA